MPRARCSFIEEKCELQEIIAIACYRKFQRRKPWRRRGNYFPRIEYLYTFFKLRLTTIRETSKPSSFHIKYIPRTSVHLPLAQNPHRSTYTTRAPTNDKPRPLYISIIPIHRHVCGPTRSLTSHLSISSGKAHDPPKRVPGLPNNADTRV